MTELVAKAGIDDGVRRVLGPWFEGRGFVLRPDRTFVRTVGDEMFHLVKLESMKGGMFAFRWGAGLAFMPVRFLPRPRFCRSVSVASFHLFECPAVGADMSKRSNRELEVSGWGTPDTFAAAIRETWCMVYFAAVEQWLAQAKDLAGLTEIARAQATRVSGGVGHVPDPRLVLSFLLARQGHQRDARVAFGNYIASKGPETDPPELAAEAQALGQLLA